MYSVDSILHKNSIDLDPTARGYSTSQAICILQTIEPFRCSPEHSWDKLHNPYYNVGNTPPGKA